MNRPVFALTVLLALAACDRTPPAPAGTANEAERLENDNLLNLVFGASVLDRDNEAHYEASVVHALDGTNWTGWAPAPGGQLGAVLALPAPARLHQLGVTMAMATDRPPVPIRFQTSLDGKSWSAPIEAEARFDRREPQLFDAKDAHARFVRFAVGRKESLIVLSLHATGSETEPFVQPSIEGCWEINHEPARFARNGSRVTGSIGDMVIDGGTDGRVYRLMWLEGPMWGYAAVTITPDGQRLTGIRWHEDVNPKHTGDRWIGRRAPCNAFGTIVGRAEADAILRRAQTWRLYGIRFDREDHIVEAESASALDLAAQIVREGHRLRLVAREFRESTEEKNRARCQRKLDAVRDALRRRGADLSRVEFRVAGSEKDPLNLDFTSLRAMSSAVDLQLVPR